MNRKTAFWDSSAIVPLCIHEAASRFARQQLRHNAPVVWWGSSVELHSAICRLHRSNQITDTEVTARRQGFAEGVPCTLKHTSPSDPFCAPIPPPLHTVIRTCKLNRFQKSSSENDKIVWCLAVTDDRAGHFHFAVDSDHARGEGCGIALAGARMSGVSRTDRCRDAAGRDVRIVLVARDHRGLAQQAISRW